MTFNSYLYFLFLPIVFGLYWFALHKNLRGQNLFLLAASYFFYGWWDWRFLMLLVFSSTMDFWFGKFIYTSKTQCWRRFFLGASLVYNLGILCFFKYFNFFIDSFIEFQHALGFESHITSLKIILPVGISFYTFQTLSYTIDVYRGRFKPINDLVAYSAFVSFFPQLVAGPIERASNLLPQFLRLRHFDSKNAEDGVLQIAWGLLKKVVVADSCAIYANEIFTNSDKYSGSVLFLGSLYFAFQIYCDFSGYSDIAIGSSKLLGFELMRNFSTPYFSRDLGEFWRRWHISLSVWFRDYVFIPLGGGLGKPVLHFRNIILTFTLSGFWHGANWTYMCWGFVNGIGYAPIVFLQPYKRRSKERRPMGLIPSAIEFFEMFLTFIFILITWVFFRANNMAHAIRYLGSMLSDTLFKLPSTHRMGLCIIIPFVLLEWLGKNKQYPIQFDKMFARYAILITVVLIVVLFGHFRSAPFIYFQF